MCGNQPRSPLISEKHKLFPFFLQVMDIVLHCLDPGHLKTKPLNEVFPAVCRFNQVTHCPATRRISVGGRSGQLALYELRGNVKCQTVAAHQAPVTALAFSPEGKFLVSYSCTENKLCFWQVNTKATLIFFVICFFFITQPNYFLANEQRYVRPRKFSNALRKILQYSTNK